LGFKISDSKLNGERFNLQSEIKNLKSTIRNQRSALNSEQSTPTPIALRLNVLQSASLGIANSPASQKPHAKDRALARNKSVAKTPPLSATPVTYADAGVDISRANRTKQRIKYLAHKTFTKGVLSEIGGFGALFSVDKTKYADPVLVSSVDGVGTKLKVAFEMNLHSTVGGDLVNHCVNDIAVQGATPLFFMDYLATGTLDSAIAEKVVEGIADACKHNGCALIGGETAEMPGFYPDGEYDLAGFIVGVVDRERIVTGKDVQIGDIILGLPSNGLHTNG
jgi:phosphoribosylformylglycinamidine cyclo-ligase